MNKEEAFERKKGDVAHVKGMDQEQRVSAGPDEREITVVERRDQEGTDSEKCGQTVQEQQGKDTSAPFIDCSRNGIIFSSFLSWKVFRLGWYNKCNFKVLYNLFILHWLFGGESYFPPPWFLDSKFTFFREVSGLSFHAIQGL